jgi:hypothetical protein
MKNGKTVYLLIGSVLVLAAAATLYFEKAKSMPVTAGSTGHQPGQSASGSPLQPQAAAGADSEQDVALKVPIF